MQFSVLLMFSLLLLLLFAPMVVGSLDEEELFTDNTTEEYEPSEESGSGGDDETSRETSTNELPSQSTGNKKSEVKKAPEIIPGVMSNNSSALNSTTSSNSTAIAPFNVTASIVNATTVVLPTNVSRLNDTINVGNTHNATNATNVTTQNASKRGEFLKGVKPIGKMETLEINVNGSTSTKNGFTKLTDEEEIDDSKEYDNTKSSRLDFIKVRAHNSENALSKNFVTKSSRRQNSKNLKRQHHRHHRHHQKFLKRHHRHSHKRTSQVPDASSSKRSSRPNSIFYQGPLSNTIKQIMTSKISNTRRHDIATANHEENMKRSRIERVTPMEKKIARIGDDNVDNIDETADDNESEIVNERGAKRSDVTPRTASNDARSKYNLPTERKYSVKGYVDNVKVVNTKPKGVRGVKKSGNPVEVKTRGEIERKLRNYKSAVVPSDEIMHNQIKDFVNQMTTAPFAPHESLSSHVLLPQVKYNSLSKPKPLTLKDQYTIAKSYKVKNETGSPPIAKTENHLKPKDDKYASSAMKNDGDKEEEDDEDSGDDSSGEDEKDEKEDNDEELTDDGDNNEDDGEVPPVGDGPVPQNKKKPIQDQGTPPPVINIQKPLRISQSPITPDEVPASAPVPGPVLNKLPTSGPNLDEFPPEQSPVQPFPSEEEGPFSRPPSNANVELQDEFVKKLEENSQNIDSLYQKVADIEGKEIELERAMGDIGAGLERIEKKLDIQQQNKHLNSPTPIFNTPPFQNGGDGTQQTFSPTLFNNGGGFLNNNGGVLPKKRPHILKQIFIPLPPKNSQAAQEIEAGAPISSPVLDRLPLPIRMVVSQIFRQQLKKARLAGGIHSSVEPDVPPREHDIDKLELELGRIPISRHGSSLPSALSPQRPKIIFFSKAPAFFDLLEKPCNRPCQNGAHCLGNNVCKCRPGFIGKRCEMLQYARPTLVEIIRARRPATTNLEGEEGFEGAEKSNKISLPFVLTGGKDDNEDEEQQRTMGHVDQSKLVNILRRFTMPFDDLYKRNTIPPQFRYLRPNYRSNYPDWRRR